MTTRVSMLLKSRASLTFFRTCFLPGRAKDLSAPWYLNHAIFQAYTPEVEEISALDAYYTAYSGNLLPTFRDNILVSRSKTERLSRHVVKELPIYGA